MVRVFLVLIKVFWFGWFLVFLFVCFLFVLYFCLFFGFGFFFPFLTNLPIMSNLARVRLALNTDQGDLVR